MKNISTKHLLIILLLVGITAILVLSVAAGLTGKQLARNNENLVAVALPLQAANNGLTTAVLDFIERQRAILSARSQPELEALEANMELRQHFNKELERLYIFSGDVPGVSSIMATMDASYDEFLSADQALFNNARLLLEINEALLLRVKMIEERVEEAQRVTEAISGKVNLAIKRTKRQMRRVLSGKGGGEELQGLVEKHLIRGQEDIQQASNDVRLSMDALPAMALNMMLADDVDTLRSIKGNQSDQLVTRVEKSLDALGGELSASPEYQETSEQVYDVIRGFWLLMSEGDRSMYELKLRSIELEKQMDQVRSRADAAAASIQHSLDKLSSLVYSIRTSATVASEKTVRTSKFTTIAVSLLTLVLFSVIGAAIYRAVIRSGEQLSKAFYSSEQNRILADQAREEALHHRSAAETANQAKSEFLANMSHELRTPMNAILGYSEMLMEEAEDLEQEDFIPDLKKINQAGNHLLTLINDVLDLSKIESGKMEAYAETFDVDDLIDQVSSTAQPLMTKNNNHFKLERSENLGNAWQDVTKLRQSLLNMLSNAAKFTHEGTITLRAAREIADGVDWLTFSVSDTGIGIPADKLDRVFEEFSQADSSTTRDYGGTGLGLTISRRFCQMQGGDMTVTSQPGEGSTFSIRLPADLPGAEAPQDESLQISANVVQVFDDARQAKHGSTVLVIDDDAEACEIIRRFLEKDFNVVTAFSGEQGLRLAHELQPAAITLDVMMPEMDGWSVLRALKADPQLNKIPVIMLSMIDDRTRGYSLGAVDYLTKPVDRELLRKTLSRYYSADGAGSVLLVEDDIETREMMARTLEKAGWAVSEAGNGQEALAIMSDLQPGLVLLDLMMPVMDGFDFLTAMRARPEWQQIPVIVITAKDLTVDDRDRLTGKVDEVLEKNADTREQLLEHLSEAVAACNISETETNTTGKNHE